MKINISFYTTANEALARVTKSENPDSCEVIFAQRVTNKADLGFGHRERPELEYTLVDFHFRFTTERDLHVYNITEDADYYFYYWLASMSDLGSTFDQFVCFRNDMKDGTTEFRLFCGLISHNRFYMKVPSNVFSDRAMDAMDNIYLELGDPDADIEVYHEPYILCSPFNSKLVPGHSIFDEPQETDMLYGAENPLSHELVQPYLAEILENLTQELVG